MNPRPLHARADRRSAVTRRHAHPPACRQGASVLRRSPPRRGAPCLRPLSRRRRAAPLKKHLWLGRRAASSCVPSCCPDAQGCARTNSAADAWLSV
ncbi:hypothetical protein J2802_004038 [Paraburkholderia caribensis]|nr:hypothetical protein [Paraburkholderia caribensis]